MPPILPATYYHDHFTEMLRFVDVFPALHSRGEMSRHLREDFAHRRLGFSADEIAAFLKDAGLVDVSTRLVAPKEGEAGKLTVAIWSARDPRVIADDLRQSSREFA